MSIDTCYFRRRWNYGLRAPVVAPPPELPQQANMYLWLESDVGTPASGSVASWTDQSTEVNTPVQASGPNQPTMDLVNTLNGKRTMHFGGSGFFLRSPTFTGGSVAGDSFAVCLFRQELSQGSAVIGSLTGSTRRDLGRATSADGDGSNMFSGTADLNGSMLLDTDQWALVAGAFVASGTEGLYTNGVLTPDVTGTSGGDAHTGITVGGRWQATPLRPLNGQIAAIYAWRLMPSAAELGEIKTYIEWYWGIRIDRGFAIDSFSPGFG